MAILNLLKGNNFTGKSEYLSSTPKSSNDNCVSIYLGPPQSSYITGLSEYVRFELILHQNKNSLIDVNELLQNLNAEYLLNKKIFELSGGEQVLIVVLSCLLLNAKVLSIDIITEQLSKDWKEKLFSFIKIQSNSEVYIADNRFSELSSIIFDKEIIFFERSGDGLNIKTRFNKSILLPHKDINEANIEIQGLCFKYPNQKNYVFRGINMEFRSGYIYHLMGANGSGKSTFAKILTGVLKVKTGIIKCNNKIIFPYIKPGYYAGYCFQNPDEQFFRSSIFDELCYRRQKNDPFYELIIEAFGLAPLLDKNPYDLPFVIRKIISIAITLSVKRPWYIFDEPTYGLDDDHVKALAKLLNELINEGIGIIIISHNDLIFSELKNVVKVSI